MPEYKIVDHVRATLYVKARNEDEAYRKADKVPLEEWNELEVTSSECMQLEERPYAAQ